MRRLFFATITILYLSLCAANGQRGVRVGFWNAENLFDTIPSIFYDDRDYTPKGKRTWDTDRYNNKLRNAAQVLDDMSLDVVGICEVENEGVVYDLVLKLKTDYNYIHRIAGRSHGRDIALLYKGDKFVPHEVRTVDSRTARTFLYVKGLLCGERIDIVVVHLPSMLNRPAYRKRAAERLFAFTDSLDRADRDSRIVIMGDFNAEPGDPILQNSDPLFFSPFAALSEEGQGTCAYDNRWLLYDNIYISERLSDSGLRYDGCAIFIKGYMLDQTKSKRRGFPLRTFTGKRYTGGYSDHLPVYIKLDRSAK